MASGRHHELMAQESASGGEGRCERAPGATGALSFGVTLFPRQDLSSSGHRAASGRRAPIWFPLSLPGFPEGNALCFVPLVEYSLPRIYSKRETVWSLNV